MQENVRFGFNQIANRTPNFAKWIFRSVLYFCTATNIVVSIVDEIPDDWQLAIGKYSVYAVTIVHSFSKLFGITDYEPNKKQ